MGEHTGVRVMVDEHQLAELQEVLASAEAKVEEVGGEPVVAPPLPGEEVRRILPVFVWIVVATVLGSAGVSAVVMWMIKKLGCSAIITDGPDGKVDIRKDCDIKGMTILVDKDGKRTIVDADIIDLSKLMSLVFSGGVEAGLIDTGLLFDYEAVGVGFEPELGYTSAAYAIEAEPVIAEWKQCLADNGVAPPTEPGDLFPREGGRGCARRADPHRADRRRLQAVARHRAAPCRHPGRSPAGVHRPEPGVRGSVGGSGAAPARGCAHVPRPG